MGKLRARFRNECNNPVTVQARRRDNAQGDDCVIEPGQSATIEIHHRRDDLSFQASVGGTPLHKTVWPPEGCTDVQYTVLIDINGELQAVLSP